MYREMIEMADKKYLVNYPITSSKFTRINAGETITQKDVATDVNELLRRGAIKEVRNGTKKS